MITLLLDGKKLEIREGARLKDVLPDRDRACCVAIIRPGARESATTESMRLNTTAGEVVVELTPGGQAIFGSSGLHLPLPVHWQDRYAAAFGPFSSAFTPSRTASLYERGDLVLGCGGYDPRRSYLIFCRSRHTSDLGAAAGGGVIGRVVSGRGVIDRWSTGDEIGTASPVLNWADISRSFTTMDSETPLEDGMEIISFLRVTSHGYNGEQVTSTAAAESIEHLLLSLEDGHFVVGRATSTHIRDERKAGAEVAYQVKQPRREGAVTLRTAGRSGGSVYVYIQDLPGIPSHTVTGQVTHGIELAKLARDRDILSIQVDPPRFDLIGLPLEKAFETASARGIRVLGDHKGPYLVVVDQDPATTMETLAAGVVDLAVVPLEKVIDIELDDDAAPVSCDIFRHLTGLHLHDVGRIPFFFNFEDVFLFKPTIPRGVNIIPENIPVDHVPSGALAITNDSRKGSGLVGVRTSENSEFGPTSEPFEGTNIIGRVHDLEKLAALQEKEIVFIREIPS
ncbi:MAG: methanogenesis marker 3 protein [Methanolinea sp.]|jgi:putative methanogenesis marker protein 3|nr:methanogenesis marker 3 protein [Methanolinea sp.]